jgi:formate/nitrite transporter FocA (FNT family)
MEKNRLEAFSDGVIANVFVALMWLVPDRRIERLLAKRED